MKEPILPGFKAADADFNKSLIKAAEEKKARGQIADSSPLFVNRLVLETSPYLLQHAFNPINWHPWGDEAFSKAKALGRVVFLSIGYSTCHWCHVMEKESFEDLEIAHFLNENFIAIKVDREERPDLDAIFMTAVQALTGHGGWPMTVFLTPEGKPFFGGTYFPARDGDRGIQTGFLSLLQDIREAYETKRQQINFSSDELSKAVVDIISNHGPITGKPNELVLKSALKNIREIFDSSNGGVRGAPKFPSSFPLKFLLLEAYQNSDPSLLSMATFTLKKMAHGGIYDQVGGGFHRYSTDAKWQIPHFEKMLYDNALLVTIYAEAFSLTQDPEFARIIRETIDFIARDMTSPEGLFYSALDADSLTPSGRKDEGYFYTWTLEEIQKILGDDQAAIIADIFQVGNGAEHEGRSILSFKESIPSNLQEVVNRSRVLLEKARSTRHKPSRDEKILTSWNALMISALAKAGFALSEQEFINRSVIAAEQLLLKVCQGNELRHSYKDNQASPFGFLDDYAFLIAALLDLFQVTQETKWLSKAIVLDKTLALYFEDHEQGGFFMTSLQHERLIARERPCRDGAEPSGNSVTIMNLLRLYELTLESGYKLRADKALQAFSYMLTKEPLSASELLLAVFYDLNPPHMIIIITPRNKLSEAQPFLQLLHKHLIPYQAVIVAEEGANLIPLVKNKIAHEGKTTVYRCMRGSCDLPLTDVKLFDEQLTKR